MNLSDTKLADITTGNKVRGSALGNLASIPSGAGLVPLANIPSLGATFLSLASIPNSALYPLTLSSWVDGAAMRNIQSMPSLAGQLAYYSIVSSLASGSVPVYNGSDKFVGSTFKGGLSLVSATTVTSATTSGNIAIDKGSYYFVNFSLINGSGSTAQFGLRFNADSGAHYHYNYDGRDTSAARSAGATGQTSVFLSPTIPTGNLLSGQLNLSQSQENLQEMLVNGQTNGLFAAASARGFVNVMGWWGNSADVTSFSIVADFAYSGVIYLYKYSLS